MSLTGTGFWPLQITRGMMRINHNNMEFETFIDIPGNLYASLSSTSGLFPDKKALIEQSKEVTYKELKKMVDIFSYNLNKRFSVKKGDKVALLMVNSIDFCVSFYAIAKLGAISIPISTKSKSTELAHFLKDSEAKVLILNSQWWPNVREVIGATKIQHCIVTGGCTGAEGEIPIEELYLQHEDGVTSDAAADIFDTAVIMYTSGTTGTPKGAILSHFNLLHSIISYKRILGLTSEDSTIIPIPIFHITGLAALMGLFVHIGGTIYLQPYFNAYKVLETVQKYNITFLHGSPTIFILLLGEAEKFGELKSLRMAACGSANMPPDILAKIKKWLPQMEFHTVYGLTETSSPATIFPGDVYGSDKIGSSGLLIPGLEAKIVGDAGEELPANQPGELMLKGSVILEKYWNIEHKDIEKKWFRTGDIAKFDEDGYLFIVDRKKDMINRGGEKIYSIEVENLLCSHPAVEEAAVVGVPDPVYGEVVKAVIVINKGCTLSEDEVKVWVSQKLAKYKVPKYVQFVDKMPHTNNNKINKKLLKSTFI